MDGSCPRCGAANEPNTKFCGGCGFALAAAAIGRAGNGAALVTEADAMARTLPLPAAASLVGTMVGEYKVIGLIGEGGMGTVYSGVQPLIGKKVAIKVLKAELSRDPQVMERFLAEARAVNRIGHPNIVDVFSFGAFPDGSQYFVMEHLQGRSLSSFLDEVRPLPYGEAGTILGQVLEALEAAHGHGIVHRDLKPDNIFLVDRSAGGFTVKLLDFGIAKFTDDGMMSGHTRTGVPMGTPLYMSPEQCRGRDIGPQSDIYSLGVILHQMFAGAPPFVAESFYEVISAHMTKVPPPLRSVADVPAELEAVVTRCLAKERADRFSTVRELSDALLPVLQQLAGSAVGAPAQLRPAPSLASMASVHEGPAAPPPAKSRTGLYIGLAAGLVVVGGVVAGVGLTRPAPVLAPASAPAVATPPTGPVEPAAPRLVTIQFMVSPPDAKWEIFVDGKKHDKLEIETPMSRTTSFEVKIVAPGYQPFIANPRPLTDLVIPVNLLKVGEAPKAGPRRPAATGGKAPAPAAPEKPAAPRVNRIQDI